MSATLEAIKYDRETKQLEILDQLKLPHQTEYVAVRNVKDAHSAIKKMVVRGAPAIAIVAALALASELWANKETLDQLETSSLAQHIGEKLDYLVTSRPTAVNLSQACNALKGVVATNSNAQPAALMNSVISYCEQMLEDDVQDNKNIGSNGSEWILSQVPVGEKISVLTICNTGSLATAGYGTALGIIRSLHEKGRLEHAYCLETRPYNQGSRLTAYELVYDNIPATLVTDSMAASLMRKDKNIKLCVVGADRVAANGDTANKIGTYQLAVVAKHHGVKFMVAAPTTSVDLNTPSGEEIVIEERPPQELTVVKGPVVSADGTLDTSNVAAVSTAASGIGIWNPSFDVTPNELIDAIATEKKVLERQGDRYNF
ncbi:methylthioribose-1-phosphate isomerase [Trichomonascus vanleenenianus]|uniref:S-methyl-5-thioribose-1-phosphate isomerase MRI1 n=1 Tax=Trichomonascus vanleenenianus TaxID=2268995 RepID=UPI003ECA2D4A